MKVKLGKTGYHAVLENAGGNDTAFKSTPGFKTK